MSNRATRRFYELTNGKLPIIGAGGIESGQLMKDQKRTGASIGTLIQNHDNTVQKYIEEYTEAY